MSGRSLRSLRRCTLVLLALVSTAALSASPASASQFFSAGGSASGLAIPTGAPGTSFGAVTPAPTATVTGQGTVTNLNVQLTVSHTFPDDLDILLVGPAGQQVILMSDACGNSVPPNPLSTVQFTFNDAATGSLPDNGPCTAGTFKPTNYGAGDAWTGAPAGTVFGTLAAAFTGTNPNGTWKLYVEDDTSGDTGTLVSWAIFGTTDDATISTGPAATAKPYPASVSAVATPTGVISDVNVVLGGLSHSFPNDLDVLVVSPEGTAVLLASDTCGGTVITNRTWTIDDEASADLPGTTNPTCDTNLTARPTNIGALADTFPAPAPPPPYATSLSAFDGQTGNGQWQAYVVDDSDNDGGSIKNISIVVTSAASDITIPSTGDADPNPSVRTVDLGRPVTDVNVKVDGLSHTWPDDLDLLLVGPTGATTLLASDACGSTDVQRVTWTIDDQAPGGLPDSGPGCGTGAYQPTNFDPSGDADTFGATAPAGPYGATLAAFDGTNPDGPWKLYVSDDSGGDAGYIQTGWAPEIQTRAGGPVTLGAAAINAAAGTPLTLTLTRGVLPPGLLSGSVKIDTVPGTATAGSDFTALSQVVSFAAGETSRTVAVPISANTAGEGAETFTVRLSDPQRDAVLGATTQATVTIPATPAASTPKPVAFTAANAITLPSNKACLKRRTTFLIKPKKIKGTTISKITVTYGKKTLATRKGKNVGKSFSLKKLPNKAFTITVKIRAKSGKTVTLKRKYKPCKK